MFELISGDQIWSVPLDTTGRQLKPIRLPNGSILEAASADNLPSSYPAYFEVTDDGVPVVNFDDLDAGQSSRFIGFTGVFVLPDGRNGAVYGADANPIG